MYKLNYSSNLISEPNLCVRQINHNNRLYEGLKRMAPGGPREAQGYRPP